MSTIAECVHKKEGSRIQSDVEELIAKSNQNKFQLNESKCKELRISFAKSAADFAPIVINGKAIEVVSKHFFRPLVELSCCLNK